MSPYWTNESVLAFADGKDPFAAMEEAAQNLVLWAIEQGWEGPPFDPFELAKLRGTPVSPAQEIADARTVPIGGNKVAIEYNPTRPSQRLRFSLAHEIAHTLFSDVAKAARYRSNPAAGPSDGWQLELLCNIAAGEILMPTDSLDELRSGSFEIERLMELRREYGVSTEALLRRATKLSGKPIAMFAASRVDPGKSETDFRIDYVVGSQAWSPAVPQGYLRPATSVLAECTAVGYTAKRKEDWANDLGDVEVQAVGAPPFPGQRYPRILGLLRGKGHRRVRELEPEVLHGDATERRGSDPLVIVHLVNDKTPNWGGAFATALRDRYPVAQDEFRGWFNTAPKPSLGSVHFCEVDDGLYVATLIGQHGYGPSPHPRVRYGAIRDALVEIEKFTAEHEATVQMPRIGAGQAGGRWTIVRELIEESLTRRGIATTVYVPPGEPVSDEEELAELTLGI